MKFQFNRNTISIVVAVVLGVLAVVMVNIYNSKRDTERLREQEATLGQAVSVVVAARDIARGTKITKAMVKAAKVREAALQPRVISSPSAAIGKVAIADIVAGEQISRTKLMSGPLRPARPAAVSGGGMAKNIPAGKRAFTIAIDAISAAGGMVNSGDYVDVIGMFPYSSQGGTIQNASATLFQNILVLAVGGQSQPGRAKVKTRVSTVTLALTPQQVELLNLAQDSGKLRLVLRPMLETSIHALAPIEPGSLWPYILSQSGIQASSEPTAPAPQKAPETVEIYRGTEKEVRPLK